MVPTSICAEFSIGPSLFDVTSKSAARTGMGWNPALLGGKDMLILGTHGGVRRPDGSAVALGYHTGHWEVGLLAEAAAGELTRSHAAP